MANSDSKLDSMMRFRKIETHFYLGEMNFNHNYPNVSNNRPAASSTFPCVDDSA